MSRYLPPTRVTTLEIPLLSLVVRADPEFERARRREIEYEFTNRVFRADPATRGAYNDNSN